MAKHKLDPKQREEVVALRTYRGDLMDEASRLESKAVVMRSKAMQYTHRALASRFRCSERTISDILQSATAE